MNKKSNLNCTKQFTHFNFKLTWKLTLVDRMRIRVLMPSTPTKANLYSSTRSIICRHLATDWMYSLFCFGGSKTWIRISWSPPCDSRVSLVSYDDFQLESIILPLTTTTIIKLLKAIGIEWRVDSTWRELEVQPLNLSPDAISFIFCVIFCFCVWISV